MLKKLLLPILALSSMAANANMFVDRSIVEFKPGESVQQDIRVMNRGTDQMYVQVEVLDVINPGEASEERISVTDISSLGLLATPKQFALPAEGVKQVRMVSIAPPADVDKVYRVNVTPILPPLEDTGSSMVRVVVAYQLLVLVIPDNPTENLVVTRQDDVLLLTNEGNSYVLLSEGQSCNVDGLCTDLPTRRLYAGNTWELQLNSATDTVNYNMKTFAGARSVSW